MQCRNITFAYHDEFSKYMKVEGVTSEDVVYYLFNFGAEKFLSEKEKKYILELFEKWGPEHLQLEEDFDDYLDNDSLKNIIGDEGI